MVKAPGIVPGLLILADIECRIGYGCYEMGYSHLSVSFGKGIKKNIYRNLNLGVSIRLPPRELRRDYVRHAGEMVEAARKE